LRRGPRAVNVAVVGGRSRGACPRRSTSPTPAQTSRSTRRGRTDRRRRVHRRSLRAAGRPRSAARQRASTSRSVQSRCTGYWLPRPDRRSWVGAAHAARIARHTPRTARLSKHPPDARGTGGIRPPAVAANRLPANSARGSRACSKAQARDGETFGATLRAGSVRQMRRSIASGTVFIQSRRSTCLPADEVDARAGSFSTVRTALLGSAARRRPRPAREAARRDAR